MLTEGDISPVQRTDHVRAIKSVGNSATTPRDLICDEDVHLMCLLLSESIASRMRELCSRCTTVEVYVRDVKLNSFTRQKKLLAPTCSSQEIANTAFALFKGSYKWREPIRSIGVRACNLIEATDEIQLTLYPEDKRREKWEKIDQTVELLRNRYGYTAIQKALLFTDPLLGSINPREDHTVHPVGYFGG